MAFFIKGETVNDKGEKIVIGYVHSACCKVTLFFIEDSPNEFLNAETGERVHPGMRKSLIQARETQQYWKD